MKPRPGAMRRVYLAAGTRGLTDLAERGEVRAAAFAVSDAMRAADPRADEEDLEYEAMLSAEALLREQGTPPVVVAADVSPGELGETEQDGRLVDLPTVPVRHVFALHVPEPGAPEDEELLWFDVTELAQARSLVDEVRPARG